jgi:hypothetical protein
MIEYVIEIHGSRRAVAVRTPIDTARANNWMYHLTPAVDGCSILEIAAANEEVYKDSVWVARRILGRDGCIKDHTKVSESYRGRCPTAEEEFVAQERAKAASAHLVFDL